MYVIAAIGKITVTTRCEIEPIYQLPKTAVVLPVPYFSEVLLHNIPKADAGYVLGTVVDVTAV